MKQSFRPHRQAVRHTCLLVSVVWFLAASDPTMQAPSPADGPWSGQMQCALSARGPNYQDDQTHTWRIVPGPPVLNGVFRQWPAVWSVQGSGNRVLPTGTPETWTTAVPETNAPLAFAVNAVMGQIRIGSQHGLLSVNGAITGRTTNAGGTQTPLVAGGQEWPFPIVDDVATATTISGTRTRTAPNGVGWRQPPGTPTTETCTWNFSKTPAQAQQQISSAATGTTTEASRTLRAAGAGTGIQSTTPAPGSDTTGGRRQAVGELVDKGATVRAALAIAVTYPNGGETVNVGTPITIRWTHLLPITTQFTADVSYDGGATWTPTYSGTSTLDGTGKLNWTFSGNGSTRARIRVRTEDGAYSDQSDADFTIVAAAPASTGSSTSSTGSSGAVSGTVQLTSPNGGETWTRPGTVALPDVKWTSTYPSTQSFDLNFSGDGGATWQKLTTVPGTATGVSVATLMQNGRWTPPYTEQALFNIAPSGGRSGGDTSDAPFHIRKPVAVTSPNGGETLTIGTRATVTFTWAYGQGSGYSPALQVSYDGGTTWTDARTSSGTVVGGGSFEWPVSGPPAIRARLRVNVVYGTSTSPIVSDDSDADFTIVESATSSAVQLTSPNGGETWTRPGPVALPDVKWTSTYPSTQSFDLNFSGDGGATWQKLTTVPGTATGISVASLMQNGRWTPPYTEQALFNIAPTGGGSGDTTDAPFHIRKPVAVTSPNGGETLTIGTRATVTFTWAYGQGTGYSPALQVSYDGGTTWTDARTSSGTVVGGGSFEWPVSGPPATRARLRVNALYGATGGTGGSLIVSDDSDADFTIAESATSSGLLQLTSPNGGETWTLNTPGALPDITWTSTYPTTQSFDVNFSANGGATWQKLTTVTGTRVPVGTLTQNGRWTPPFTDQALFNIAPSGGGSGDTSDAPFHIRKPVAVTSPNGGETLTIGTVATVTFTWAYAQGSGFSPALQVSYDGGTTWTDARTSSGSVVSGGSFQWPVSGPPATRARLRVNVVYGTSTAPIVSDDSDADFAIVYAPSQ